MTNLRQEIEEIENCHKGMSLECQYKDCPQCKADRICSAIKAKVDEMPRLLTTTDGGDFAVGANHGVMCQHNSDKSYWERELK